MSDLHVAESSNVNPDFWFVFMATVSRLNISDDFVFNNIKINQIFKNLPI